MRYYPLNFGSRTELDLTLNIIAGELPTDLGGYVFVNSAAGTVNFSTPPPSDLPDGTPNQEYGATVLNGDGLLYRFDFSEPGRVLLKSRLLKPACYYADEATRYGTDYYERGLHFISKGLSRTHLHLGTRNQLNTALVAFKFRPEDPTHLAATFDAGRPHLIDPTTLEIVTPIGAQAEWLQNFPDELEQVFPMVYATAHPCFDPYTHDFYAANFQKSLTNLIFNTEWDHRLSKVADFALKELHKFADWVLGQSFSPEDLVDSIRQFIPFLNEKHDTAHKREFSDHFRISNTSLLESEVRILHWRGGKMDSWRILDGDSGEPIAITQTVHQMALTEDYVILSDSTLKFAMDMLLSLPFGHHDRLNALVRKLTTHTIRSETPCYLIRRADLIPDQSDVVAVRCDLPYETIHFSVDYRNPEDRITLHGSHNSAICGGEWVRPFDRLAVDPDQPVPANRIGGMATSAMDISRVGKHVIDGRSGELLESQVLHQKGFPKDRVRALAGPHTWGAGLYTFRGYQEAEPAPDRIRYIFHQFNGLVKEELTRFVYELYLDYNEKHAEIPAEKILDYHRKGIPGCLCRLDTEPMELTDHFPFGKNEIMLSLQFIPRRRDGDTTTELDPGLDGYLLCLMQVGLTPDGSQDGGYSRQLYLFDAADLRAGPVCKLSHDNLAWSLTIHSIYCPEIAAPTLDYRVDIPEDCNWVLERFPDEEKQRFFRDFLEQEVFPHYVTRGE